MRAQSFKPAHHTRFFDKCYTLTLVLINSRSYQISSECEAPEASLEWASRQNLSYQIEPLPRNFLGTVFPATAPTGDTPLQILDRTTRAKSYKSTGYGPDAPTLLGLASALLSPDDRTRCSATHSQTRVSETLCNKENYRPTDSMYGLAHTRTKTIIVHLSSPSSCSTTAMVSWGAVITTPPISNITALNFILDYTYTLIII